MKTLITLILILTATATVAVAQDLDCFTYSDMPAALNTMALPAPGVLSGVPYGTAYLLVYGSDRLDVLDVADPAGPRAIGSLAGLSNHLSRGLPAVVGHHVYLPNNTCQIVDLSDPTQPTLVGSLGVYTMGLAARGTLLAVARFSGDVELYDSADPLAPTLLGTVPYGPRLAIFDDVLAVMASGVWLYDIADPAAPTLITELEYLTESGGSGSSSYYRTTQVLDVERLDDHTLAMLTNYASSHGSFIYGNYEIQNTISRRRLDFSDPLAPTETASSYVRTTDDWSPFLDFNLTRSGDLLIEGRDYFDPWSVDLATVCSLPAGQAIPGGVFDLGDGRVAVCDINTLNVVAVTDPPPNNRAAPLVVGSEGGGYTNAGIGDGFVAHLRVFLGDLGYDETYLSIHAEPGGPAVTTESWDGWANQALACAGRTLVVGNLLFRVEPDLSLTEYPLDLTWSPAAVALADEHHLAAIDYSSNLILFDVTDPAAAVRLGETPLAGGPYHDLIWQNDLILAVGQSGLQLARVDGGVQPVPVGQVPLANGRWVAPSGSDEVIVGTRDRLVRVAVDSPYFPQVLGQELVSGLSGPPLVQAGLAYVAQGSILSLHDATTLQALGSLGVDQGLGRLGTWDGQLIGAGTTFRGYAFLPPACELGATGIDEPGIPALTASLGVHPNPFNPQTMVEFSLVGEQPVRLVAFDLRGRQVRELASGTWSAGIHRIRWDGRDDAGDAAAAGVYLLRLESTSGVQTAKAVLVK